MVKRPPFDTSQFFVVEGCRHSNRMQCQHGPLISFTPCNFAVHCVATLFIGASVALKGYVSRRKLAGWAVSDRRDSLRVPVALIDAGDIHTPLGMMVDL